jgi:hypothetical protein
MQNTLHSPDKKNAAKHKDEVVPDTTFELTVTVINSALVLSALTQCGLKHVTPSSSEQNYPELRRFSSSLRLSKFVYYTSELT